jgi:hypothetical protein
VCSENQKIFSTLYRLKFIDFQTILQQNLPISLILSSLSDPELVHVRHHHLATPNAILNHPILRTPKSLTLTDVSSRDRSASRQAKADTSTCGTRATWGPLRCFMRRDSQFWNYAAPVVWLLIQFKFQVYDKQLLVYCSIFQINNVEISFSDMHICVCL